LPSLPLPRAHTRRLHIILIHFPRLSLSRHTGEDTAARHAFHRTAPSRPRPCWCRFRRRGIPGAHRGCTVEVTSRVGRGPRLPTGRCAPWRGSGGWRGIRYFILLWASFWVFPFVSFALSVSLSCAAARATVGPATPRGASLQAHGACITHSLNHSLPSLTPLTHILISRGRSISRISLPALSSLLLAILPRRISSAACVMYGSFIIDATATTVSPDV
jgi:hypothetical protein